MPAIDAPSPVAYAASASMTPVIERHNPLSTKPSAAPRHDAGPAASGRSGGASASTGSTIVIFSGTAVRVACAGGGARRTDGCGNDPTIVAHSRGGHRRRVAHIPPAPPL